jgi:L-ascorbate metabolism protein UlaG (beta-lactamase superfamily)
MEGIDGDPAVRGGMLRGGDVNGLGFSFTWYGHACVEVVTEGGRHVLFDPWFGNPTSPRRADSVERCDLLLVTHGHGDHVGDAVALAARLRPAWPCIHEMSVWLGSQLPGGEGVVGMNKGGTIEAGGLRVTMVRAEHSAGGPADESGATAYLGEPAGFVVELENGRRVYHAGDTDVFGDMRLIRELHRPDVAFLPIGGHYTMGPREAAAAVELLGVSTVVPIHYGTFPILAGTPAELRRELDARGLGSVRVVAPERGVPTDRG